MSGNSNRLKLFLVLSAVLSAAVPNEAYGQRWNCLPPTLCGAAASNAAPHSFAVRLEHSPNVPAVRVPVRLVPPSANVHILNPRVSPNEMKWLTDDNGVISGYVEGPISTPLKFTLIAELPNGTYLEQNLAFGGDPAVELTGPTGTFYWYAGSQIRNVTAWAPRIDDALCRRTVVRFAPRGGVGSVSIDSVPGTPEDTRCVFRTDWRLGDPVGRQVLQARIGSGTPVHIDAIARRKAGLRLGLAAASRRGGVSTIEKTEIAKISVERDLGNGVVLKYDSTVVSESVATSEWSLEAMPLILFDTPVIPRWDWLRISIGASALDFDRDFFWGLSLGQLRWRTQAEDAGFDIQGGVIISRRERLKTPTLCEEHLLSPREVRSANCATTESLRWSGFGLMASADAQGLIGAVGKMLGF